MMFRREPACRPGAHGPQRTGLPPMAGAGQMRGVWLATGSIGLPPVGRLQDLTGMFLYFA